MYGWIADLAVLLFVLCKHFPLHLYLFPSPSVCSVMFKIIKICILQEEVSKLTQQLNQLQDQVFAAELSLQARKI